MQRYVEHYKGETRERRGTEINDYVYDMDTTLTQHNLSSINVEIIG